MCMYKSRDHKLRNSLNNIIRAEKNVKTQTNNRQHIERLQYGRGYVILNDMVGICWGVRTIVNIRLSQIVIVGTSVKVNI